MELDSVLGPYSAVLWTTPALMFEGPLSVIARDYAVLGILHAKPACCLLYLLSATRSLKLFALGNGFSTC